MGNELWAKWYGDSRSEDAKALVLTSDGGFGLAGSTTSFGATRGDAWLVKVNDTGVLEWNAVIGAPSSDLAWDVIEAVDGTLVLGGRTSSFGAGGSDAWIVKVNASGSEIWNATFGGSSTENARRLVETADGFALGGNTWTYSENDYPDAWLGRLGPTKIDPGAPRDRGVAHQHRLRQRHRGRDGGAERHDRERR